MKRLERGEQPAPTRQRLNATVGFARLERGELALEGYSVAGEETWFRVSPPGIGFDCGRGATRLLGVSSLFLTHGHLDHAAGLPWLLSQRRLQGGGKLDVFVPKAVVAELERFVNAAEELERVRYRWDLIGLEAGDRVNLGNHFAVLALEAEHRVPALGYSLIRRRRRLREAFQHTAPSELAKLRQQGVAIEEPYEEVWLTYAGDTGPGWFDRGTVWEKTRILVAECTFLGGEEGVEAAAYGHLSLEDFVARREQLAGLELLVLHHLSRRYRPEELREAVNRRLSELADRVVVWGEFGQ